MPTPSASEARLERRISELAKSVDRGFDRVHTDMDGLKQDVKAIHREAIPHRVANLEKWQERLDDIPHQVTALKAWRDQLSARLWSFLIGSGLAAVAAWIAVFFKT